MATINSTVTLLSPKSIPKITVSKLGVNVSDQTASFSPDVVKCVSSSSCRSMKLAKLISRLDCRRSNQILTKTQLLSSSSTALKWRISSMGITMEPILTTKEKLKRERFGEQLQMILLLWILHLGFKGEYLFIGAGLFTIVFCIIEMDKPDKPHNFEPQIYKMERGARDKLINDYNTMSIWDFNDKYGDIWDFTVEKDDTATR